MNIIQRRTKVKKSYSLKKNKKVVLIMKVTFKNNAFLLV